MLEENVVALSRFAMSGASGTKRLPDADIEVLRKHAKAHDRPLTWVVRAALSAYAAYLRTKTDEGTK